MDTTRPNVTPDGRYSLSEAAKILGVHKKTIYRYSQSGKLRVHYRRINKLPYVEGREILRIWDESTTRI